MWFADVRSALAVDGSETEIEKFPTRIPPELDGVHVDDVASMLKFQARKNGVNADQLLAAFRMGGESVQAYEAALRKSFARKYEALRHASTRTGCLIGLAS